MRERTSRSCWPWVKHNCPHSDSAPRGGIPLHAGQPRWGLGRMPDRYWGSDMDAELFDPRTAFAELGWIIVGVQNLNQTLQRIADRARKTSRESNELPRPRVDGGQPKTVVFTGQLAV